MMNRAVLRVTSEQIATALRIREGVRIVAAASDPLTCDIDLILEGPSLSVVREGTMPPVVLPNEVITK